MHRLLGIVTALGFACLAQPAWVSTAAADTHPSRPIRLISLEPRGWRQRHHRPRHLCEDVGDDGCDHRGRQPRRRGRQDRRRGRGALRARRLHAAGRVGLHALLCACRVAKLSYDPIKDFEPISLFATVQDLLVVSNPIPAKTLQELIALAKANPGKLNYASGGPGSTSHFAVAMFIALAGIQDITVHVPFRGRRPGHDRDHGQRHAVLLQPDRRMVPFVEANFVRGLAISGDARSPALPNVPTIAEAGMPQYKAVGWSD